MKTVRFYIQQDNRTWTEDVTYAVRHERQADLELAGANIYHATLLTPPKKAKTVKTPTWL